MEPKLAEKGQNQYTSPPLTETEAISRFREILNIERGGSNGTDSHDWMALFVEFIRSDIGDYKGIGNFLRSKKISGFAIQRKGGRTFWNAARNCIKAKAMLKAVEETPGIVAKRYKNLANASEKLTAIVNRMADRMIKAGEPLADGTFPPQNPFEASALKTLAESTKLLTEIVQKMTGDEKGDAPSVKVDLYQVVMNSLNDRDKNFGAITIPKSE